MHYLGLFPSMLWTHSMRVETLSLTPTTPTQSISCNNWKDEGWRVSLFWPHFYTHRGCSSLWGPWHDIYLEIRGIPAGPRMKTVVMAIWCCCVSYFSLGSHIAKTQNPGSCISAWRRAIGWSSSWGSQWGLRSAYYVSNYFLNKLITFGPFSTKPLQSRYESLSATGITDTSSGSVARFLTLCSCLLFHRHSEFVPSQICQPEALLYTKKELLYPRITKQHALIFLCHSFLFLLSGSLIVTIFQLPIVAGGVKGSFLLCSYAFSTPFSEIALPTPGSLWEGEGPLELYSLC